MDKVKGKTVAGEFVALARRIPQACALRWMEGDGWGELSYGEVLDRALRVAAFLSSKGIGRGDRVVLMMRNMPEFHYVDLGALLTGATPVSIYNSSAPEQVEYLAGHCEAKLGLVEDVGFLERFLKVKPQLPDLEHLGIVNDPDGLRGSDVFTLDDALATSPADPDEAAAIAQPDDLATIIYTSGTTGPPKGVMLTHQNILWTAESLKLTFGFSNYVGIRVISYLPMAHIAERMVSHYSGALLGYEVTTCPEPSEIANYAREVHPNLMFGVPRVWEKVYAGVNAALAAEPEKKQKVDEAIEAAIPIVEAMSWDRASDEDKATYDFLDEVAFSQIRQLIGLDEVQLAVTGAAPLPAEMLQWFRAIGIPLAEVYGMSENCGPMTFEAYKVKPGTVGPAIPGCEVDLADDGEIICRGGNVFVGYLKDPEKTAETLDEDGWLHSGDIGEMDEDGYLRVIDRKKELIITAGGKNISPANLESALKMIPLVGQAAAIGDKRKFVSALLVLDPEVAPAWAHQRGIDFDDLEDLAANEETRAEIEAALSEVMAPFNNTERVKKFVLLGEEWLPDSDVLTPTSKLKRRHIHAKYADLIDALYD
ncbi:MAG: long-chain fatty acid--CoA ligase [Actinobacteria bacterium]|nr:MAG: long-chain fatty acid--CoA ligase [Actinomycetota bacterium]RIK05349.1 MAG: long-chain fatty acid--CoA ligase [Acidobacteriota bacterium]